jgi:hypothetical protein
MTVVNTAAHFEYALPLLYKSNIYLSVNTIQAQLFDFKDFVLLVSSAAVN